jgi:glycosyltransferase involved in cell wall biosynthesis
MRPYLHAQPTLDLSVVVPIYNERDNVRPLTDDILRECAKLDRTFEVILVNDGSTDGSTEALDELAAQHDEVKVLHFSGNRGQTIAIAAGMYHSRGRAIVLMDGDRQNDPADIGMLLDKLAEGYACVSGWRKNRADSGWRRLPSRIANRIVRRVTRVPIHDLGCTLKAYTRDALNPRELFGEMHRFLAVYVHGRGGRMAELVVRHHPRTAGQGKYGLSRTARVLADIILIRVLFKYRTRPSHMLAKLAQYVFLAGAAFGLWWLILAARHHSIYAGTMPFLAALILGMGAVLILTGGLVCELVMRNRYVLTGEHPWDIARTVNLDPTDESPNAENGE